jgi:GNAT superfamily N-acetyltransferase
MSMQDSNDDYRIRLATATDVAVIARQRASMFLDMGVIADAEAELLRTASESWIADLMAKQQYLGWFVEHGTTIVAGGGVLLRDRGPGPECFRIGRWAHAVNVYTSPEHRRRGLARRLMRTIIEWCAHNQIDHLTLGASDQGKPLYESLGFVPTAQMMLPQEQWHPVPKK